MKKSILIITAVASCIPFLAQAEEGDKPERKRDRSGMREEMLKKFDKDGDGKLNDEEKKAMQEEREKRHKEMLEKYDTDKDGKISKEEREAAMKAWHQKLLKEFDADGDGKLSDEESQTARKTLRERGERAPFFSRGRDGKPVRDGDKPDAPEKNL